MYFWLPDYKIKKKSVYFKLPSLKTCSYIQSNYTEFRFKIIEFFPWMYGHMVKRVLFSWASFEWFNSNKIEIFKVSICQTKAL